MNEIPNKLLEVETAIKQIAQGQFPQSPEGHMARIYLETANRMIGNARSILSDNDKPPAEKARGQ